jgi:C4-dicarboxylate-binding protein DctP
MKRFFGSAVLVAGLILTFCFSATAQDKTFNIKLSLHIPPKIDVGSYAASLYFKTQVEQLSAGRLKVQIFPSNQLGSERESLEGLKLGTHQMDFTSSGSVPSFFPEVQCLAIPYLFPDKAVAWKVFDGWFGKEMAEAMAKKTGMRILGIGENGIRHFVLKNK